MIQLLLNFHCCDIYKRYPDYPYALDNGIRDFKLCCEALNITPANVATNRLTYGTNDVRIVTSKEMVNYNILDEKSSPHFDGIITDEKQITLMTYVANCILVIFLDVEKRIIGACHCSWTTTLKGIIESTINIFTRYYGSNLQNSASLDKHIENLLVRADELTAVIQGFIRENAEHEQDQDLYNKKYAEYE